MTYRTRRFFKTLSVIIVVIVLIFSCTLAGYIIYEAVGARPKRGIIIVTALLSGGLIETAEDGTETVAWDPIPIDEFPIQDVLRDDGSVDIELALEAVTDAVNSSGSNLFAMISPLLSALEVDRVTGESVKNIGPVLCRALATSDTEF